MTRRALLGLLGAVATLGGAGAVVVAAGKDGAAPASASQTPASTTTVRRQTLAESVTVDGELGYGEPAPMRVSAGGTVTWLPKEGSTIKLGGTLVRADNRPVVLLTGALPIYRPLSPGTDGPEVRQFERNLHALGHDGFTVDDEYTAATARAVRRWQKSLGLPQTGTVESSWAIVATGTIRVAQVKARLGDAGTGDLLSFTGVDPVVVVDAKADAAGWATPGTPVSVTLPTGTKTAGTVRHVGAKATAEDGADPTVPVTIALADRKATGQLQESPVEVTYTGEQRKDVLTVPVAALVALAEGRYGLQVVENGTSRYLPVKVGMFADGRAEVTGAGLADGMLVGMPG